MRRGEWRLEPGGDSWVRDMWLRIPLWQLGWIIGKQYQFKEDRPMRTSEDRKRLHLLMWGIIAETGCYKKEALERIGIKDEDAPVCSCFACEEAGIPEAGASPGDCKECPIVWGTEKSPWGIVTYCQRKGSPFYNFDTNFNKGTAAKALLALPFKGSWAEGTVSKDRSFGSTSTFSSIHLENSSLRPKTLHDLKVGNTVWFRNRETGTVIGIKERCFIVGVPTEPGDSLCRSELEYSFRGELAGHPEFGQVVFATYQDLVDRGLAEPVKVSMTRHRKEVIKNVVWVKDRYYIPSSMGGEFQRFLDKPPMTMTLEWEEEEGGTIAPGETVEVR